ncbi:MAG: hypothetical protein MRY83_05250 [Flavobacteriales bacterium]|nr:hypothetical protein [Flavobacteriales bacterium]
MKNLGLILILILTLLSCNNDQNTNNDKAQLTKDSVDTSLSNMLNIDFSDEPAWFTQNLQDLSNMSLELKCWREKIQIDGQNYEWGRFPKMPCEATPYWQIASKGMEAIPLLVQRLSDQTKTKIYHECKGENLNINELSYLITSEIFDLPLAAITQSQYCVVDSCSPYRNFEFANQEPSKFQNQLVEFFDTVSYSFEEFDASVKNDCSKIKGKYRMVY